MLDVAVVGVDEVDDEDCVELLEPRSGKDVVVPPDVADEVELLAALLLVGGLCDGLVIVGLYVAAIVPEYNLAFQYPTAAKGC